MPNPVAPKANEGIILKIALTPQQAEAQFLTLFDVVSTQTSKLSEQANSWANVSAGEKLALMHLKISQALDAIRSGNAPSTMLPGFSEAESRFAEAILLVMDFCQHFNMRLGDALVAKLTKMTADAAAAAKVAATTGK